MQKKTRIGIDCRLAGKKHAGIGRYIKNLVKRLPKKSNIKWVLFFYDQAQADEILNSSPFSGEVRLTPIRHYSLAEQLKLPKIFKQANLDLLHVPHFNIPIFYSGKLIVTIHDLLWHQQKGTSVTTLPKWQYWLKYWAYKFVTKQAIKKSLKVIVPSETIKKTISNYYPKTKNKVLVIKEGVSKKFSLDSARDKQKNNNYNLLYVGSLYPHKNLKLIFKALQKMPDYKLNIVSTRDAFAINTEKLAVKLKVESQVDFLGYVSDKKLIKLYQNSFALVQPSLSEGFGLTGVEAMASGCPVLASNIAVFKEIYSDAAIYFDPQNTNSFINAVQKLEKSQKAKIIKKGIKQVGQYDWDKMVKKIIELYRKIIEEKK
ncbi:MAG: glycosyltransferase family 1 protein [Patescibacteria group bacterium]